jgi:hypothetical protein
MARKPARKAKTKKASKARRATAPKRRSAPVKAKRPTGSTARRAKAKGPGTRAKGKGPGTRAKGLAQRSAARKAVVKKAAPKKKRVGGTGRESTLDQTPATGRTITTGPTNPMPTKRSTGTASGAGDTRRAPGLERERKQLREVEESLQQAPSSLNMDRHGSAARTGRAALRHAKKEHTETSPALTAGDVDADWEDAYAVGDEAPGGDNPTPDQDVVDEIGAALGVTYADDEELKAADKIIERDRHRWELDPASAEDYKDHDKD